MADPIVIYQQPITPNYDDLPTYSKGPSQNYYNSESGDSWLNLRLNRAQEDDDDEWGRTEAIALRSIIDHVTGIWQTLYGIGGAGSEPPTTSVIGALQGVLEILNVDATPANSTITIGDTIIDKNGVTIGDTYLKAGKLYLDSGILLDATDPTSKFFKFYNKEKFYLNFKNVSSVYSMEISIPTGTDSSIVHSFNNSEVNFDTQVSFSAGDTDVTTLDVSSSANIATFLTIGNISSRSKITDTSLTLGFNNATSNIFLGLQEDGLCFYITCGGNRAIEAYVSPSTSSWLKFRNGSTQTMWIGDDGKSNGLVGLRGGANLRFVNQDITAYDSVVSDAQIRAQIGTNGSFIVYSGATGITNTSSVRLTGADISFYAMGTGLGLAGSITSAPVPLSLRISSPTLYITSSSGDISITSALGLDIYATAGDLSLTSATGNITLTTSAGNFKLFSAGSSYNYLEMISTSISFYTNRGAGTGLAGSISASSAVLTISGEVLVLSSSVGDIGITSTGRLDITVGTEKGIALNLPEGSGSAPAYLDAGDLWVDSSAGYVVKVVT